MFDTIIVGGGAAGLAAAIMIKKRSPQLNIAIFEQLDRVGKKISTTGNGRCNITNKIIKSTNYYTHDINKVNKILADFPLQKTKEFFSSIGVEICFENNKAYPRSFQASSVVDALRFSAQNADIHLFTSTKIINITKKNDVFNIITEDKSLSDSTLKAKTVILATGGLAGGNKLGSNGDGYKFLKNFGHNIISQSPVIVQIKTENTVTKSLKGIKTNAKVKIYNDRKIIVSDYGEVLFCDYGLSGPPILQLSRYCTNKSTIVLDLFNEFEEEQLLKIILKRRNIFADLPLTEFFAGLLHKRIGQEVLKQCNLSLSASCKALTDNDCRIVAKTLKNFKFKVTGNTGFSNAQATSGGADLKDFDDSLMSKRCKGLFAVGEVLDVDGDCGGYNLQWAWSSANSVANSIILFLGG